MKISPYPSEGDVRYEFCKAMEQAGYTVRCEVPINGGKARIDVLIYRHGKLVSLAEIKKKAIEYNQALPQIEFYKQITGLDRAFIISSLDEIPEAVDIAKHAFPL
jgi:hypothetical protein